MFTDATASPKNDLWTIDGHIGKFTTSSQPGTPSRKNCRAFFDAQNFCCRGRAKRAEAGENLIVKILDRLFWVC